MVASVLEVSSACWRALSLTGRSWQRTEGNQKGETSCLLCRGVVGTGSGVLTCSLCNPACASDIAVKWCGESSPAPVSPGSQMTRQSVEIGRASCRERVCQYV